MERDAILCEAGCRELVGKVLKFEGIDVVSLMASGFYETHGQDEEPVIVGLTDSAVILIREMLKVPIETAEYEIWAVTDVEFKLGCSHSRTLNLNCSNGKVYQLTISDGMPEDSWSNWLHRINCLLPCSRPDGKEILRTYGLFRLICENQNPFDEIRRLTKAKTFVRDESNKELVRSTDGRYRQPENEKLGQPLDGSLGDRPKSSDIEDVKSIEYQEDPAVQGLKLRPKMGVNRPLYPMGYSPDRAIIDRPKSVERTEDRYNARTIDGQVRRPEKEMNQQFHHEHLPLDGHAADYPKSDKRKEIRDDARMILGYPLRESEKEAHRPIEPSDNPFDRSFTDQSKRFEKVDRTEFIERSGDRDLEPPHMVRFQDGQRKSPSDSTIVTSSDEMRRAVDVKNSEIRLWTHIDSDGRPTDSSDSFNSEKRATPVLRSAAIKWKSPRKRSPKPSSPVASPDVDVTKMQKDDPFLLNMFDKRVTNYIVEGSRPQKCLDMTAAEQPSKKPEYAFTWTYKETPEKERKKKQQQQAVEMDDTVERSPGVQTRMRTKADEGGASEDLKKSKIPLMRTIARFSIPEEKQIPLKKKSKIPLMRSIAKLGTMSIPEIEEEEDRDEKPPTFLSSLAQSDYYYHWDVISMLKKARAAKS